MNHRNQIGTYRIGGLMAACFLLLGFPAWAGAFSHSSVVQYAKDLASHPFVARQSRVPEDLRQLSYDAYRMIQFDEAHTLWAADSLPFQLQFFHPGFVHDKTVQINQVTSSGALLVPFEPSLFLYRGDYQPAGLPHELGFSGFRVLHALNQPSRLDELIVFQGASYFRALGRGQRYGLSSRGLAIDTAASRPEEFPVFEEFWVERPADGARSLTVHALLNSPSATGAYQFSVTPGLATVVEVSVSLFVRSGKEGATFGFAPLTSMFWHGESSSTVNNDYRPEVHDSDGMLIHRGNGEWVWRPLANPPKVRTVAYADENPKGFGLVQRDRRFESYEDLEACYHLRPSAWIEPRGPWGKGEVRLVEIPSSDETNDNIVAFWVPQRRLESGKPIEYAYRIHWYRESTQDSISPPAGVVVATRLGRSQTHQPELQRLIVDFGNVAAKPHDEAVEAVLNTGSGAELVHQALQYNSFNGTWRLAFALRPDGTGRPVELRGFLRRGEDVLTETWTYLWQP